MFDTYLAGASQGFVDFIDSVHDGRIVVISTKDDFTSSLTEKAKSVIKELGSDHVDEIKYRGAWAFIGQKPGGGDSITPVDVFENPGMLGMFPNDIEHSSVVMLSSNHDRFDQCKWATGKEGELRKKFCSKYEGYGALCRCDSDVELPIVATPLENNRLENTPIAVMTGNRAKYLYKSVSYLLKAKGASRANVIVMCDGFHEEVKDVAELLGVQFFFHDSKGEKNGRICYHYEKSLGALFDKLYPKAPHAIIMEEDLQVAPDFLSYFSQTLPILEADESVYCISAWNDQCYKHSCQDPQMLYRIQTMPGLGWLLTRKLWKKELQPKWPKPELGWDWDMWMRTPQVRKNRECIIPDVSRTFHFGSSGLNVNYYFQEVYFNKRKLNDIADVQLKGVERMTLKNYEADLHATIPSATALDHSKSPCDADFFPVAVSGADPKLFVVYFLQTKKLKFENWIAICSCLKIWDLDARGIP